MKFTHQIKFNSVPEWREHYINYAHLKKIVYAISKAEADESNQHVTFTYGDEEHAALLSGLGPHEKQVEATEDSLRRCLDKELIQINAFYLHQEAEILASFDLLVLDIRSMEPRQLGTSFLGAKSLDVRTPQPVPLERQISTPEQKSIDAESASPAATGSAISYAARIDFWNRPPGHLAASRNAEKKRLRSTFSELYLSLNDLQEYLRINKEGFRKILKKHDKVTSSSLQSQFWPLVEDTLPTRWMDKLEAKISILVELFAVMYLKGDPVRAKDELSRILRDHIKVERNTVWRDMVALERRAHTAKVEHATPQALKERGWVLQVCITNWPLAFSVLVFCTLLNLDLYNGDEVKQNCLAMLALVSCLWALEAVPLFSTSMLVPPLCVMLRVLMDNTQDPPVRMTAVQAADAVFHSMFSQTIMLLLGGFSIAAALSKHFIAKKLAIQVLSRVGRKPRNVLLASMFVATFLSMWISNVAAPVLCFSLVEPILRTLDTGNSFAKCLVMGIALASNIGGMTSPISSPQNIFAIERMSMDGHPPSWLSWFAVALPVSFVCVIVCWLLILICYKPWRAVTEVRPLKPNTDPLTFTQVYVIFISVLTVALWCCNTAMQKVTGEMGIIAILPLFAFFGFEVLSKDDFNGFLWNVVMLAMGGCALGEAVKSSGLLATIAVNISAAVQDLDLWQVCVIFCALVLVCTTFISHTVGAIVILPIVQSVGEAMPGHPHPKLLVMASALMCSGAMGLPVSGFPNMNAVSLEDATGDNYVNSMDFIWVGIPGSIASYFVIITLGYKLMQLNNL